MLRAATLVAVLSLVIACHTSAQEETTRVLFLSKSSGFQHSCIAEKDGESGHVQKVLHAMAANDPTVKLTTTKDASLVNAKDLENFDLVILYTTGDLTKPGDAKDGGAVMPESGVNDLIEWVKGGGALMGFHCATDTFGKHRPEDNGEFIKLIGGEFGGHGKQFEGALKVVDKDHPVAANIPDDFPLHDEWYVFINLNKENMHVVALLDPRDEGTRQEMYDIAPYPVIWTQSVGEGRVYYNAAGHREDVWDRPEFQQMVYDAAAWALGEGPADSEPNYTEVVPEGKAE